MQTNEETTQVVVAEPAPPAAPTPGLPYIVPPEGTRFVTRRIVSRQVVDEDGVLTLRIPMGERLAKVVILVEVVLEEPVPSPEELGHPLDFVHPSYGISPDFLMEDHEAPVSEEQE